jgi:hypothetical protein
MEKSNWVTVLFAGTLESAMKGETKHEAPTTPSPNVDTLQSPLSPSPYLFIFGLLYHLEE